MGRTILGASIPAPPVPVVTAAWTGRLIAGAVTAVVVALALPAGPAVADHTRIVDLCLGVDHPPFDVTPPGGGNSYIIASGRTEPALPNAVIDVEISGPEGSEPFQLETDDDGWVNGFAAAIQSYSSFPVLLTNEEHEIGSGVIDVGPDDVPCPDQAPISRMPAGGLGDLDALGVLTTILAGRDLSEMPDPHNLFWGVGEPIPDRLRDHIYSDPAEEAGAPRGSTDISRSMALDFRGVTPTGGDLGLGCDGDGSYFESDAWDVACTADGEGGSWTPLSEQFLLTALEMSEPIPAPSSGIESGDGLFEYAVVYESNGDPSDDWMPQGVYTWDGFQGADRWYVVRGRIGDDTWTLEVIDAATNSAVESDARAILAGDTVVFIVPGEELDAPTGWRGYAFNHDGSYRPEYSAMDVTGADPTEPLLEMPAITFASDLFEEASPSPSPSPAPTASPTEAVTVDELAAVAETTEGSGGPLWPLVAIGGLVTAGGATLLRRRDADAVVAPPDPCADEIASLDDARSRCDEARAEAAAARERSAEAAAALAAARTALAEARSELPGAGDRDRSSWVESEGRRIDSGDVAAGAEADAATWDAYRSGEITAEQAMERWGRRGTPEEVDRLREADARARRIEGELAAAEAEQAEAAAGAEAAEAAASAACAEADAAAARLERCRERAEAEASSAAAAAAAAAATATPSPAPTGTGTTVMAPPTTGKVTTAGGDDPRDTEAPKERCCDSGMWLLYGRSTTSFGFVVGRQLINLSAVCVDDTSRSIEFEVLVFRLGLGAHLGAGGLGGLMWGARHPLDVYDTFVRHAGGLGFDLDVGTSLVGLLKSGKQLHKGGELWGALKKLPAKPVPPPKLPPGDLEAVKKAAAEAAKEFGAGKAELAAGAVPGQAMKGSLADLVMLPLGLGGGIAGHYSWVERSQVIAMSGCGTCQGRRRR